MLLDKHRVHLVHSIIESSFEWELNKWLSARDGAITVISIQYSYGVETSSTSARFSALIHYTEPSKENETIQIG